jgi:UDP-glucuronate 4-epimerase
MALYLVTGAAGFIASKVSEFLLAGGHQVIGVDNLCDAYDIRLKKWRLKRLQENPHFIFYNEDICKLKVMESICQQHADISGVINLAARAGVRASVENPWAFVDTNVNGTLNMLEICKRYVIPKLILASTSSLYGANAPIPTAEDADSNHPLQPYAASKKGAEALCHSYHFLFDIDITVFRYFTVYGPAGRPDMVMFRFCQWIAEGRPVRLNGDGEQSRGFTFVDDIARGTILGLKPLGFDIINLGGHEVITINRMIHILEDLIGRKAQVEYLPGQKADMMTNHANVDKARQILAWQPQVSLEEGMRCLVEWYMAELSWTSQVLTP